LCIFLGYDNESKAYRLYDKIRRKVLISRDVVFDESKVGYQYLNHTKPAQSAFEFPEDSKDDDSTTVDNVPDNNPEDQGFQDLEQETTPIDPRAIDQETITDGQPSSTSPHKR